MNKPRVKDVASVVGISTTYASDILSGKQRPSRAVAIRILRCTGWRHDCLAGLSDTEIDVLERVQPWAPRQSNSEAA
jgi:transcriptional regulator with XRE-family HTH domain